MLGGNTNQTKWCCDNLRMNMPASKHRQACTRCDWCSRLLGKRYWAAVCTVHCVWRLCWRGRWMMWERRNSASSTRMLWCVWLNVDRSSNNDSLESDNSLPTHPRYPSIIVTLCTVRHQLVL